MARKNAVRTLVELTCECGSHTYHTEKIRRNTPDRITLKKYCPRVALTTNFENVAVNP